ALAMLLVPALALRPAAAQEEFPPPSGGKAPLVVVFSGATGSGNYRVIAGRIAALGYDVALFDSNTLTPSREVSAVSAAVKEANRPFELTVYPGVRHGFSVAGSEYNAPATDDALAKTAAALRQYLGR